MIPWILISVHLFIGRPATSCTWELMCPVPTQEGAEERCRSWGCSSWRRESRWTGQRHKQTNFHLLLYVYLHTFPITSLTHETVERNGVGPHNWPISWLMFSVTTFLEPRHLMWKGSLITGGDPNISEDPWSPQRSAGPSWPSFAERQKHLYQGRHSKPRALPGRYFQEGFSGLLLFVCLVLARRQYSTNPWGVGHEKRVSWEKGDLHEKQKRESWEKSGLHENPFANPFYSTLQQSLVSD